MGYIYLLTNDRMPGLVKIGRSHSPMERVQAINSATGVPGTFKIRLQIETANDVELERRAHEALAPFRVWARKEFFEIPLGYAKMALSNLNERIDYEARQVDPAQAITVSSPLEIGAVIKKSRKERGWTQAQLAEVVGCGQRVVIEIERGKATAQIGIIMKLCAAVGCQLATIG